MSASDLGVIIPCKAGYLELAPFLQFGNDPNGTLSAFSKEGLLTGFEIEQVGK
ncbi:hypothetical protein FHS21_004994 [Phyllobacterium trifolii]|uniref:Uncharacterized protein n=1 Tax=Phyllobacterium trifolii TaxID=300193 RepID=A0A839UBX2_9HYPH|nr:hypothetical protein [Phyllobacterium trifolii]MBB3148546.1 hypothetical protein [Phyllobacterium trifolii]